MRGFSASLLPHRWSERGIHRAAWAVAILLGLLQAWVYRHGLGGDEISYLDIADHLRRGDWGGSITGHWSPLYPATLAPLLALVRPSAYQEPALAHAANFAIYLGALGAFTLFLREFARLRDDDATQSEREVMPRDLLLVLGYVLFLWSTLKFVSLRIATPDILVTALAYLAAAFLVRIRRGAASAPAYLALGATLGLAYLAKTAMLLVAPAFLLAAFAVDPRRRVFRLLLGVLACLTLAMPWIVALSYTRGHLTIGDAGRDAYAWVVNDLPHQHWQGEPPGYGKPLHPTRRIHDDPPVYEFADPIDATYPPWYDPSYWYDGVNPRFSLADQFQALRRAVWNYFKMVDVLLVGWLILLLAWVRRATDLWHPLSAYAFLQIPSSLPLALYALVLVEPRYVAPFLVLMALALVLAVRLPPSVETPRLFRAFGLAVALVSMAEVGWQAAEEARRAAGPTENRQWLLAASLRESGIEQGSRVGWIGGNRDASWPWFARVKVVAEVPSEHAQTFWAASPAVRDTILDRFAAVGAHAVVASYVPQWADTTGWTGIGDMGFAVQRLPRPEGPPISTR